MNEQQARHYVEGRGFSSQAHINNLVDEIVARGHCEQRMDAYLMAPVGLAPENIDCPVHGRAPCDVEREPDRVEVTIEGIDVTFSDRFAGDLGRMALYRWIDVKARADHRVEDVDLAFRAEASGSIGKLDVSFSLVDREGYAADIGNMMWSPSGFVMGRYSTKVPDLLQVVLHEKLKLALDAKDAELRAAYVRACEAVVDGTGSSDERDVLEHVLKQYRKLVRFSPAPYEPPQPAPDTAEPANDGALPDGVATV